MRITPNKDVGATEEPHDKLALELLKELEGRFDYIGVVVSRH